MCFIALQILNATYYFFCRKSLLSNAFSCIVLSVNICSFTSSGLLPRLEKCLTNAFIIHSDMLWVFLEVLLMIFQNSLGFLVSKVFKLIVNKFFPMLIELFSDLLFILFSSLSCFLSIFHQMGPSIPVSHYIKFFS